MFITLYVGVALITISAFIKEKWLSLTLATLSFGLYFEVFYGNWMPYLLFLLGVVLLVIEFYVPGFSIPGILGILATTYALYLYHFDTMQIVVSTAFSLLTILLTALILSKTGKSITISPDFILDSSISKSANKKFELSLGETGISVTDLRPVGRAKFNEDIVDVLSEVEFIAANTKIYITKIEGSKIIVRKEPN